MPKRPFGLFDRIGTSLFALVSGLVPTLRLRLRDIRDGGVPKGFERRDRGVGVGTGRGEGGGGGWGCGRGGRAEVNGGWPPGPSSTRRDCPSRDFERMNRCRCRGVYRLGIDKPDLELEGRLRESWCQLILGGWGHGPGGTEAKVVGGGGGRGGGGVEVGHGVRSGSLGDGIGSGSGSGAGGRLGESVFVRECGEVVPCKT